MMSNMLLLDITQNPILLGALIAILRSVIGYAYNCVEQHKLLPYSASELLITLGQFEFFFITLGGIASLDTGVVTIIAVVVQSIRSLRQAIADAIAKTPK